MTNSGHEEDGEVNLRYNSGITVNWSAHDQIRLEQLLRQYEGKLKPTKYALIALELGGGKTIRDVALRVKWMQNNGIGGQSTGQQDSSGRRGEVDGNNP